MDSEMKKKLDERLVNGEITPEEYKTILNTIESTQVDASENDSDNGNDVDTSNEAIDADYSDEAAVSAYESNEEKGFLKKLRDGDYGLAKTYWLYGIVVSAVFGFITRMILMATGRDGLLFVFGLVILGLIYTVFFQAPGLWRAAKRYQGPKIWAIFGQIVAVIAVIGVPFVLMAWITLLNRAGVL